MLINDCRKKNYLCIISNPCFEFWLLLHLSDVKTEYSDRLDQIKTNAKISDNHTFVSNEVSMKANHKKRITEGVFRTHYLPNIRKAIKRGEQFKTKADEIIDDVGTNIPALFLEMGMDNSD